MIAPTAKGIEVSSHVTGLIKSMRVLLRVTASLLDQDFMTSHNRGITQCQADRKYKQTRTFMPCWAPGAQIHSDRMTNQKCLRNTHMYRCPHIAGGEDALRKNQFYFPSENIETSLKLNKFTREATCCEIKYFLETTSFIQFGSHCHSIDHFVCVFKT